MNAEYSELLRELRVKLWGAEDTEKFILFAATPRSAVQLEIWRRGTTPRQELTRQRVKS